MKMNMTRRMAIAAAASTVALASSFAFAQPQAYPTKPIRLLVPFPPGGVTDVIARSMAEKLSASLGQPVVVENKPGAGTMLASEAVAQAPADGYTLLIAASSLTINPALYTNIRFDPVKDFAPITLLGSVVHVLVVNEALPVRNVAELIRYAKSHPGKLSYASVGNGTSTHLEMELFKNMADVFITHIPYRGSGPALLDVLGGRIDLMFDALGSSAPHMKSGKLRALGVSSLRRSPSIADVPSISEAGLNGFEAMPWLGLLAPAGTSPEIIARLNKASVEALASPEVKATFSAQGIDTIGNTPQQFASFIRQDLAKWEKVVKASGAKID
jgi:tripartite-type tricarboxylate transporter receptor subunit TctC